ncbi:MAG TPA: S-adenosylmethionine:tRNA ribosyltransferase-isomerase [Acidimicrobiales bacterium]|nr:S-adenosylmethionine:tRNA ribosyltransferase-isomerase [Acidimicrobiales bacterium]
MTTATAPLDFELPQELEARVPPESRGRGRDDVRLLVSRGAAEPAHACFRDLPTLLEAGDLLVINTSATLPAALAGRLDGSDVELHLSGRLQGGDWLAELRRPARPASLPEPGGQKGDVVSLPGGGLARLVTRWRGSARLWVVAMDLPVSELAFLQAHGRPIRYGHVPNDWPLATYQTVYAIEPGSAEMPSAGRAFTSDIITGLVARGISVSPLVLHAGVSSLEVGEPPPPEWYQVPVATARRVNDTRAAGGRVVAVGTTVVRALETVVDDEGLVREGVGWTETVVTPDRPVRAVDGLLTGWHEPRASHLLILQAIAEPFALESAYQTALDSGYLWHELGDLHLILPASR